MTPEKGQLVQVRFNNGIFFDGVVEEWTDQKSVLKLPDGEETVIIQKTLQDVMLVKILVTKSPVVAKSVVGSIPLKDERYQHTPPRDIYDEFNQLKEAPPSNRSLHRMAELKDEMNKLEREEIAQKFNTFEPTGAREIEYGLPKSLKINPFEECIASDNTQFASQLSNLFGIKKS